MKAWYQNSFFKTQFVTAFNILTVSGETFVAESMELTRSRSLSPALRVKVEKFILEEHSHSHGTNAFNKKFCSGSWRVRLFQSICKRFISFFSPFVSEKIKLAMVATSELWTANAASLVMDYRLTENMNEAAARNLFEWHCKEEIAHGKLPIEVMRELKIPSYARLAGFVLATFAETLLISVGCVLLILTAPEIFLPKTWKDAFTFFFTDEKIIARSILAFHKNFERALILSEERNLALQEILLSCCLLIAACFNAYEIALHHSSLPILLVLLTLQTILIIQLVLSFHDCLHQASFKSKAGNAALGRLIGAFGLWPFHFLQESHLTHHRKTGIEEHDTEILHFTEAMAKKSTIVRILSQIARTPLAPLLFTPLIQARFFSRWMKNNFLNWRNPTHRENLKNYAIDSLSMIAFWSILNILTPQVSGAHLFLLGYLTPGVIGMAVVYLFANPLHTQMISIPDQNLPIKKRVFYTSRSFDSNTFVRLLIGNLNYHIEHHLNPTTNRWDLRKISLQDRVAYREYAEKENLPYALHTSYFSWYLNVHLKAPQFNTIQNTEEWKKSNPVC